MFDKRYIGSRIYIECNGKLQTINDISSNLNIPVKEIGRILNQFVYLFDLRKNLYFRDEWGSNDFCDWLNYKKLH